MYFRNRHVLIDVVVDESICYLLHLSFNEALCEMKI
jgi:hypothetical protein